MVDNSSGELAAEQAINTSTGLGGGGELEDARWFSRPQIALMLRNGAPSWPPPEGVAASAEEAASGSSLPAVNEP